MPQVTLRALANFSYATRRLVAGESFTVSERDAKVLLGIKKAERLREPGSVEAPPAKVIERAAEVTPPPAEPTAVPAMTSQTRSGGSKPGLSRRRPRARKRG